MIVSEERQRVGILAVAAVALLPQMNPALTSDFALGWAPYRSRMSKTGCCGTWTIGRRNKIDPSCRRRELVYSAGGRPKAV